MTIDELLWANPIAVICGADRCQERIDPSGMTDLAVVLDAARSLGWRHDTAGDWCPWHSPQQETTARRSLNMV